MVTHRTGNNDVLIEILNGEPCAADGYPDGVLVYGVLSHEWWRPSEHHGLELAEFSIDVREVEPNDGTDGNRIPVTPELAQSIFDHLARDGAAALRELLIGCDDRRRRLREKGGVA